MVADRRKTFLRKLFQATLVALMLVPSAGATEGVDWNDAIANTQRSANEYNDYAMEILGSGYWIGPINESIKFHQHRCAILGRMLGYAEAIQHLEHFDLAKMDKSAWPKMDESNRPIDLLVFALTLYNWVAAAEESVEMAKHQRISVWNLECIGDMKISPSFYTENDRPNAGFSFRTINPGRDVMEVYGNIDEGFFERFSKALRSNPDVQEVSFGSAGGSIADAIKAGYEIREAGLTTVLHGNCFSACPLLFVAGVDRILWAAPHRLGFHQIYYQSGVPATIFDPIYGQVERYLVAMGVDPNPVINWMLSRSPTEVFIPSVDDLCAPRVATFVQRRCGFDENGNLWSINDF